MSKIIISKTLNEIYMQNNMDISYALSELIPYLDFKKCASVTDIPSPADCKKVEVQIPDTILEQCKSCFSSLTNIDSAIEVILWNNFFSGMTL